MTPRRSLEWLARLIGKFVIAIKGQPAPNVAIARRALTLGFRPLAFGPAPQHNGALRGPPTRALSPRCRTVRLALLAVSHLSAGRGGRVVVPLVSFALEPGEALLVTGANGAGKSTLLRTLAGLLPALGGRIAFAGEDDGPRFHYLGHRNALKPTRTVRAELAFWARFAGGDATLVEEALRKVGLPAASLLPCGALSAGQARRVAAARLLLAPRPVWILDEPTAALDADAQERFAALGRRHLEEGGAIVAATHQPLGLPAARELRLEAVAAPVDIQASNVESWDEIW